MIWCFNHHPLQNENPSRKWQYQLRHVFSPRHEELCQQQHLHHLSPRALFTGRFCSSPALLRCRLTKLCESSNIFLEKVREKVQREKVN
jgi:hypothetical protein